eukprot:988262_1
MASLSRTLSSSTTSEANGGTQSQTHYHIGSPCKIYSKSGRKEIEGEVVRIIQDEEGSWLEVKYRFNDTSRTKQIPNPSSNNSYSSTKLQPIHTPHAHPIKLDANPNDTPWTPSTSLDSSIRNQWSIGSAVEVYSVLCKQWMNGKVQRIIEDEEGEWLEIEYSIHGDMRRKQVQRDHSTNIRPTIIQRLEHTIPHHIHTQGAKYSNTNNIIVTNTKHEYYVPNLEDQITRMEKEKKDWKATLYDVYMYDQIESKLNTRGTTKITFKTPQRRSHFAKYIKQSTTTYKCMEIESKSKIVDSILTFHYYSVAVSHMIGNYYIFARFKLSVVFIIHDRRDHMHALDRIEVQEILDRYNITYLHTELMGRDVNASIQLILKLVNKYKQTTQTKNGKNLILLFKLNPNRHEANRSTLFIYNKDRLGALVAKSRAINKRNLDFICGTHNNVHKPIHHYYKQDLVTPQIKSSIIPYIADDHWSLFVLRFEYMSKKHVTCYWTIDGKTLRFFPEHMETVWPNYFEMTQQEINSLIYHHRYRHQFGIGLYDELFCTMYYAITKKRFLSTHYYRNYQIENRFSFNKINISLDKARKKQLAVEYKAFKKIMTDDDHCTGLDDECNAVNRLVFMLRKHADNELEELCYILKKCKVKDMNGIQKDVQHIIDYHSTDFKELFTHKDTYTPKLACWPLRRRTRSIFRVKEELELPNALAKYEFSHTLSTSDEENFKEFEMDNYELQIKTIQRILDNVHCQIYHRDPSQNFRQMWVDKNSIGKPQNSTASDFEQIILNNAATLWSLYSELKEEGMSDTALADLKQYMTDKGYSVDNSRMIEDSNRICAHFASISQKYLNIIKCHLNDYYLHMATICRKYEINQQMFMNAERNDIKDLLLHENMEIDRNTFNRIYDTIRQQILDNVDEDSKHDESDRHKQEQCIVYRADSLDEWLSPNHVPRFKSLREELMLNQFRPISRSDYIDTESECQLLHQNTDKNTDIMSRDELMALKVFTDYSQLQSAFSKAFYDDQSQTKDRKREFYQWSLILQQAMHYAGCSSDVCGIPTLWRGLQGLPCFDSFEPTAHQPTSFSLTRDKAIEFCGDQGVLLESHGIVGIPLKWLSSFEHEDEWWCFKTPLQLDRIHVRCPDVKQQVQYLRYTLQNMSDTVPNGDINRFDFDGADMKQYVIDLLDCEVLKPTKYKGLNVLQRLFFELKQYWIVNPIWDHSTDDIECCTVFQRQYLLETHVFANMDEQCKSYEYKTQIIEYMARQDKVSIGNALCEYIVRYIDKTDCESFIEVVSDAIETYNCNSTRISDKQKDIILHYFEQWDHARFAGEERSNVINLLRQEAGLKGIQSIELYESIQSNTNIDQFASALNVKAFDDFYHAMIRYKQIKKCNPSQLIYVLKTHLLPHLEPQNRRSRSNAHKYHEEIVEYIQKHELNGEAFMCEDEDTFSENITRYIHQHKPSVLRRDDSDNKSAKGTQNRAFIKVLKRSIDEHQATLYKPKKKKTFLLDRTKIVEYFTECNYTLEEFNATNAVKFRSMLGKALNIKAISAKKLYAMIEKRAREGGEELQAMGKDDDEEMGGRCLNLNDLYDAMRKWQSTSNAHIHTFVDCKLRQDGLNAFDLLIGEFQLVVKHELDAFEMKLNESQQELLRLYPPHIMTLVVTNTKRNKQKQIKSSAFVFRMDIWDIVKQGAHKECLLECRITLKYDQYE